MDPFKAQQTGLQAPWGEGPLSFLLSSWTWAQYRDTINPDKSEGRTRTTELALEKLPCLIYLASMWMQWHYVVFSPQQDQLQQDKKKKKSHVSWHIFHFDSYSRAECLIVLNDQGISGTFFFFFKEKEQHSGKMHSIPYQQSLRNRDFSTKGHLQQRLPLLMGSDHRSMNNPLTSIGLLVQTGMASILGTFIETFPQMRLTAQ